MNRFLTGKTTTVWSVITNLTYPDFSGYRSSVFLPEYSPKKLRKIKKNWGSWLLSLICRINIDLVFTWLKSQGNHYKNQQNLESAFREVHPCFFFSAEFPFPKTILCWIRILLKRNLNISLILKCWITPGQTFYCQLQQRLLHVSKQMINFCIAWIFCALSIYDTHFTANYNVFRCIPDIHCLLCMYPSKW